MNDENHEVNKYSVDADLLFFFNNADAAIGYSSNCISMIFKKEKIPQVFNDNMSDKVIIKVGRLKKIRRKLQKLPIHQQRLLKAVYCYELNLKYSFYIRHKEGTKAGSIFFAADQILPQYFPNLSILQQINKLNNLYEKKIKKSLTDEETILMFLIKDRADKLLKEAQQAYQNIGNL